MWRESKTRLNIVRLGSNIDEYSLFAPILLSERKDTTKGLVFQDIFKEETVGGCWHRHAVLPLPKYGGSNNSVAAANFKHNQLSTSNRFLGQRSQKLRQAQWIIFEAKNTNEVEGGP